MTSEALRQSIRDYFSQPFEPRSSFIVLEDGELGTVARVPYDEFIKSILQLIATSLPEKRPVKPFDPDKDITKAMWADITNMNSGFNEAIDDFKKLLGGGDNG